MLLSHVSSPAKVGAAVTSALCCVNRVKKNTRKLRRFAADEAGKYGVEKQGPTMRQPKADQLVCSDSIFIGLWAASDQTSQEGQLWFRSDILRRQKYASTKCDIPRNAVKWPITLSLVSDAHHTITIPRLPLGGLSIKQN